MRAAAIVLCAWVMLGCATATPTPASAVVQWRHAAHTDAARTADDSAWCREKTTPRERSSRALRIAGAVPVFILDVVFSVVTFGATAGSLLEAYSDGLDKQDRPSEVTYEACMANRGYSQEVAVQPDPVTPPK